VKLDRYIQQLLQENEMVIIPGFGAFISEYQPAEMNEESKEIKPPSSKLVFNPQIRNNDGLLVGYVAEALRCSHFEALQKIEKERDNFLYRLDKGEKVELDELGVFSYNEKNELEFVSEEDKSISLESFGLETTSLKEDETESSEIVGDVPAEENEPVQEDPEGGEETMEEPKEEAETTENKDEEEPAAVPVAEEPQTTPEEEPEEKEEKAPVVSAMASEPREEKKKKRGWIWLLVILLPLIAVSVFILMKDKGTNTPVSSPPQTILEPESENPVAVVDSGFQDSTGITEQDTAIKEEPQPKVEEVVKDQGPKFYLVGGSFKEKENAETYMEILRKKGFEPFDMGMYGSFYIIGLGVYSSEDEALAAKSEMLENNPESGIWVLKR